MSVNKAVELLEGDCLDVLATLEADSIDAVVTDPPYGLGFMGKHWDSPGGCGDFPMRHTAALNTVNTGVLRQGGRQRSCADFARRQQREAMSYQEWCQRWAEAVLRVAKPGAHLLAFGGTRTFHRLACALEDAGWEIRDCLMWLYGQGFPKAHDVGKMIDKAKGAVREVVGTKVGQPGYSLADNGPRNGVYGYSQNPEAECAITAPATAEAARWTGWANALKPAWEPIILARKPLDGTVAENVQKWGTGALNIDGCRVPCGRNPSIARREAAGRSGRAGSDLHSAMRKRNGEPSFQKDLAQYVNGHDGEALGRWPANVILDGSEEVLAEFAKAGDRPTSARPKSVGRVYSDNGLIYHSCRPRPHSSLHNDSGTAARFFYCAKASRRERGDGNAHPTVKPLALMRYLVRLVTPPAGLVLDPFLGSGTTAVAALQESFRVIGIERESEYLAIAKRRLANEHKRRPLLSAAQ